MAIEAIGAQPILIPETQTPEKPLPAIDFMNQLIAARGIREEDSSLTIELHRIEPGRQHDGRTDQTETRETLKYTKDSETKVKRIILSKKRQDIHIIVPPDSEGTILWGFHDGPDELLESQAKEMLYKFIPKPQS